MKWKHLLLAMLITTVAAIDDVHSQRTLVNQAGYLPDQPKFVYFITSSDSFLVADKSSGEVLYRGPLVMTATKDPATGVRTYRGEFTSLSREGTYQISTLTGDTSEVFPISWTAFEEVYKRSLKGFYFQRCGNALLADNAGVYARPACHVNDGFFHSSTGKSGPSPSPGGWHDAGDYGKYVVNAGITVGTLLLGYELAPSKFAYDDLNIPESGNGTPDLLDEVRYELEWFLTMQDSADGGVYFKVTTENFDAFEMPHQDRVTRYIYEKSSTATGDFAACLAHAARLFAPFDSAFAGRCLAAARRAWTYLQAHPTIVPAGGFQNPPGTGTGGYGDGNDSDERLWAASELYETTGEAVYRTYFESHVNDAGLFTSTMGWPNVRPLAQAAYLFSTRADANGTIKTQLRNGLSTYCATLVAIATADGLNVTLRPDDYGWGSNSGALNNAALLLLGYIATGTRDYYVTALQQLNYVLGCNRIGISFVTGVGPRHTMNPHHRPSYADGIVEPIPGLLAGGPDKYLDDDVLRQTFTSTTPPARCYVDDWRSYASNEIAINWNAPLVFLSGYLNESPAASVEEERPPVPVEFALEQNYPNPFNPRTEVRSQMSEARHVRLEVYDLLGREVAVLFDGWRAAGTYQDAFDAHSLASGVYIYRMTAGTFVRSRKMMVLK